MSSKRDTTQQSLHGCFQAIVDDWYSVVKRSSLTASSPGETRQDLSRLLERALALLREGRTDPAEARAIGAGFVPYRLEPDAVGVILGALVRHILVDLPADLTATVCSGLPGLVAGLAAGFLQEDRMTVLAQQEEIRGAYVQALRRVEEELLLRDAGVESSINAIGFCSPEGRLTYVNAAFLRMWGYDRREDVVGRDFGAFGDWGSGMLRVVERLEREGGWIGELVARRKDGSRFDVQVSATILKDEAGQLLQVMGSFIDITERKRAQEALQRRAAQLAVLNQIGDRIAALQAPGEVLETAVSLVRETLDYHQVAILTLDREQKELVIEAIAGTFKGASPIGHRIPVEEGISGWVARHDKAAVVNEVARDSRFIERFPREVATRSELAVPIERGGELIGVLDVQSPCLGAFTDVDRIALETLADQIAVGLENARLYEALQNELTQRDRVEARLRRNVQRLEILHDIDQAILGAKSIEQLAEAALHHLRRLVPCQRASIELFDEQASEVVVLAAVQPVGERLAPAGARFPIVNRAFIRELLDQGPYVYVTDAQQLPESAPLIRAFREQGLLSFVVAPIRAAGQLLGVLGVGADRVDGFEPGHGPIVKEIADSVAVAIRQARLLESVRQQGERLRQTMARLAEAEEAERRRVVQVLHDRVGQNLTALDLNLSLVRSRLAAHDLDDLCTRLDRALSLVEQTNACTRRVMADLRPPALDDYGLLAALRWYAEEFSSRMGIEVRVSGDQEAARGLSAYVETVLFRIAQEALHNTVKHAHATGATVELSARDAMIKLTISDNGTGFSPEEMGMKRVSWGLLTMKERAESVGARCIIQSHRSQGTRVVVEVPR